MCKCVWWLAQSAYIQKSNRLQKPHSNFVLFRVIGLFICETLNKLVWSGGRRAHNTVKTKHFLAENSWSVIQFKRRRIFMKTAKKRF